MWVVAVRLVAGEGRRAVVYETGHLVLSTGWVQPLSVGFVPCDYVAQWRIVNFAVLGRAPGSAAAAPAREISGRHRRCGLGRNHGGPPDRRERPAPGYSGVAEGSAGKPGRLAARRPGVGVG